MKNTLTIFKREIKAYFNSAIAYIFIIVFILISTGIFMTSFFLMPQASMRQFFYLLPVILCVFLPAVTMRLWAEDRKGNTLELLLTFPIKTHELVLGKFLASFVFYLISLAATLPIPIMILILGRPDLGTIFSGYLGAVLMGSFFLALGIFVSGFCKDQIVAFIIGMMSCFLFFLLGTEFTTSSIDGWMPGLGSFLRTTLGMAQHFISFEKGILDNRSLIYFIIGTIIFLILNGFWLEGRMRPKAKTIFLTVCLICIGILILINFLFADLSIGRFDLTEGKVYTISQATRQILGELKAPALIKLFISRSEKMPSDLKTLERDIRDKLEEFQIVARGKFQYKIFHMEVADVPRQQGGEESLAESIERKGIRPFQVKSIEADEVGVKLIYSAVSIAYKDKPEEIIPQVVPSNLFNLEYTIISKIHKMTLDKPVSVALVAPYEEKSMDEKMKQVLMQLGQTGFKLKEDEYELIPKLLAYERYKVSRIRLTEEEPIPEDTDTLIILEPEELNERQRFEINRFLVNGGSILLAVQKYTFDYRPFSTGGLRISPVDKKPQINPLLERWGLMIDHNFLMDKQHEVISLTGGGAFGIFSKSSPVKLPIQIKLISDQMNKDISITARLSPILYLWGNALNVDFDRLGELGFKAEILLQSSIDSWKVPFHREDLTKEDITMPVREKRASYPLAVLIQGQFPNAFNGREIPEWPKQDQEEGRESYEEVSGQKVAIQPKPGKLILIGCATMFNRQLFQQGGHMNFFLNGVDVLSLDERLINVRSRQVLGRSIKRLSSITRAWWRIFTTFFVPIVLCIIGSLKIFIRKRSKWAYLKMIHEN